MEPGRPRRNTLRRAPNSSLRRRAAYAMKLRAQSINTENFRLDDPAFQYKDSVSQDTSLGRDCT